MVDLLLGLLQGDQRLQSLPNQQPARPDTHGARTSATAGHVLVSYQWSAQPVAELVRARLEAGGVPCWMDNTAPRGMRQPKLIDSMASAVQDAAAVVCLLSPAFQSSENCKSELMYAREIGKPIFPVMLEGVGSSRACCHGPHCTAILHCHPSLILR